jgi:response regulator RpfG family c-di-GMP phosphodiesterase
MKGIHLDPEIVDAFIEAQHEFIEIYEQTPRG